ncbi:aminotransferase class V-fold PLP-dependent enzyme (plasmid) [Arthrobacter sp. zg-Y820]|uniref:aminotransferase class V-fold PLP-dependent enzyme n=1 Tax=unclassified Arthrobacter TaxID=235627 RepID=UPI001E591A97|nr:MULTISPECIES: aminotransferase class V-fold PLP-dependent enzyme [unclassified Arthrobacter]MCC9198517.1 aminotransferase class V-fold PLP-dependent enzyme [Arthrobacter sp. zg-Y820]MDK1281387.1 aminotransferase class V-fold PLP-dependent enzyme [Arthrobacter sp. zg.Y820]WIB11266.1 aminotransferase class V-fold PLP-dependent enzyme [Arthrobacter sp. zg-Y820]
MKLDFVRNAFGNGPTGYFNTPSMGLPTRSTVAAMKSALDAWVDGTANFGEWEVAVDRCRAAWARMCGVAVEDVGAVPSVTSAVAAIAHNLQDSPGVLVAHRDEFRSLLLPAVVAFGPERIRWVQGPYTAAAFENAIDDDVVAAVASSVSSADGARLNLGRIMDACDATGAQMIVDSTQSEGIVSLSVDYRRIAAVVTAGYKGLLAPRGTGFVYASAAAAPEMTIVPSPYGMEDNAVRGSYGPSDQAWAGGRGLTQSPAWLSWVGAVPAFELLESVDPKQREAHVLALAGRLRDGLEDVGIAVQESDLASSVVSMGVNRIDVDLAGELERAGVRAAVRLGRLRLGLHLYTEERDVDRALNAILDLDLDRFERI